MAKLLKKNVPKKNLDARMIFNHAERFHWSNYRLRETTDAAVSKLILIPALVLSAFASELYLKCLHCIDSRKTPSGHSLESLFYALPEIRRKRIEVAWNEMMTDQEELLKVRDKKLGVKIPRDLPTALSHADRAFEQLRYEYEDSNLRAMPQRIGAAVASNARCAMETVFAAATAH